MSKLFSCGAAVLACSALLYSHDPITTRLTWNREIAPIVYKRCSGCHHSGGAAMSLTTYEAARPWAKAIRDEILSRRMPPWGAVKGIRDYFDDPSLSQPEIDILVAWVEGGAPEGDAPEPHLQAVPGVHSQTFQPHLRTITVTSETTLGRAVTLAGIRPKDLADNGSLDAWAIEPDGAVERLIWLVDYRKAWTRTYVFTDPLPLPAGSKLRVSAKTGAAVFYLQ